MSEDFIRSLENPALDKDNLPKARTSLREVEFIRQG
jgi:hypothetical protein